MDRRLAEPTIEQTIEPKLNLPYRDAERQLCVPTNYYARLIWSLNLAASRQTKSLGLAAT